MRDFFNSDHLIQPWHRLVLSAEGVEDEWGAGEDQDQDKLPPAPTGGQSRGGEWVHHCFVGIGP